jgi:hypothetical protein
MKQNFEHVTNFFFQQIKKMVLKIIVTYLFVYFACGQQFNIVAFGAVGDGFTLNTQPILSAIRAAEKIGGGIVLIPFLKYSANSTFVTGAFNLSSNIFLEIEKFYVDRAIPMITSAFSVPFWILGIVIIL